MHSSQRRWRRNGEMDLAGFFLGADTGGRGLLVHQQFGDDVTDMPDRKLAKVRHYAVDNLRKVVCTTQRAGSTSMIEAMAPAHAKSKVRLIDVAEVLKLRELGWPVLLWLRDPLERFASAYAIFGAGRIPLARELATLKYRTPKLFADMVFLYDDAHWAPVSRLHSNRDEFLPTRVYPFYDLAETWAKEMPGCRLALLNETSRKSWDELAQELDANYVTALTKHYEEDLKMLDWCNEYGYMEKAA